MNNKHRIVFFGTPDFAAESLSKLLANNFNVVAVVTAPDRPKGRGKKLAKPAVKEVALQHALPIMQPLNLKSSRFLDELRRYRADLQVVVAFRMLPRTVWGMPPLGTFNLHASLLPQYRGAAPINWVIINGEKETGITTFFLKHEIDTGNIIFQEREPVYEEDTAGSLYERLMEKGAHLVVKTARAIQLGDYPHTAQKKMEGLKSAPKIFKKDCLINWKIPDRKVVDFIRGLSPHPGAWTTFEGKVLKIFNSSVADKNNIGQPGEYKILDNVFLFQTRDGVIAIGELQLEGKKRMNTQEFLRGYKP